MNEWTTKTIAECLVPLALGSFTKVQTRDYKSAGRYPIVDQGQEFIAGWTDDATGLICDKLPVIVFGDHTRTLKYVDFPFVRGADGTQVLKPREDIDSLFFYYACRALELPSRGYNRHFSILKQRSISLPPPSVQKQIGLVLKLVDDALMAQSPLLDTAQELKLVAMRNMFTRGLKGEAQKETDIGLVPESWVIEPLGSHHSVISGGTPSRANSTYWAGGSIPWVKTSEVNYCVIRRTEEHITQAGVDSSAARILPVGTLLLAMYGQGVTRGKVAMLGIEATCNQACAAIRATDDEIDSKFLYHFLTYRYDAIRQLAHGGQQQNLNLEIVRAIPVAFPRDLGEQRRIVEIVDNIDSKVDLHQQKRVALQQLFCALMDQLMSGKIGAMGLDLSWLATPKLAMVAA